MNAQRILTKAMIVMVIPALVAGASLAWGSSLVSPPPEGGQQEGLNLEASVLDTDFAYQGQYKRYGGFYNATCDFWLSPRNSLNTVTKIGSTLLGLLIPDAQVPTSPACPACSIPCDSRLVCKQYAIHYEPCSNTSDCGGRPFYRAKHRCSRCCWPSACSCGGWSQVSLGCVYDPDCTLRDSCQSCGTPGNCPAAASAPNR